MFGTENCNGFSVSGIHLPKYLAWVSTRVWLYWEFDLRISVSRACCFWFVFSECFPVEGIPFNREFLGIVNGLNLSVWGGSWFFSHNTNRCPFWLYILRPLQPHSLQTSKANTCFKHPPWVSSRPQCHESDLWLSCLCLHSTAGSALLFRVQSIRDRPLLKFLNLFVSWHGRFED